MPRWVRFTRNGESGFGVLNGDRISTYQGDMFADPTTTGATVQLNDVTVLTPTKPGKMIALWNNFHALAAKLDLPEPAEPLYFLKAENSFLPHRGIVRRPRSYDGPVVFEGELGIVIGITCKEIQEDDAVNFIFGYTCINDVTAARIIGRDPTFAQWARAKSYDTFGVFGPVIATDIDPGGLVVRTVLNGQERQNYPVSDMIFSPHQIVAMVSQDMTLEPGDVICCGTSVGVGAMKEPENTVEVTIDGIGTLENTFVQ